MMDNGTPLQYDLDINNDKEFVVSAIIKAPDGKVWVFVERKVSDDSL